MPAEIWVIVMLSVQGILCCPCVSTKLPAHIAVRNIANIHAFTLPMF